MQIEYEATFLNIDKDDIRNKLKLAGASLIKPEFLQKRVVFNLPEEHKIKGAFLRVRDESDKITMSLKIMDGEKIENQRELCLEINSFADGVEFLKTIGCERKAYQETKRELWILNGVEVTIDEWPFLEPFVEIEGKNENEVKEISLSLGFDYSKALFCGVDTLYNLKYGISQDTVNNEIKEVVFGSENPFKY
jgi:adenylate cyclase class 2